MVKQSENLKSKLIQGRINPNRVEDREAFEAYVWLRDMYPDATERDLVREGLIALREKVDSGYVASIDPHTEITTQLLELVRQMGEILPEKIREMESALQNAPRQAVSQSPSHTDANKLGEQLLGRRKTFDD